MRCSSGMFAGLVLAWITIVTAGTIGQSRQAKWDGNAEARKPKNPTPATQESIAAGQQLFHKYCRFCHGADAKGNGPMAPQGTHPPNLTDDSWEHGSSDGEIYVVIRDGIGPKFDMKGQKSKLSDQDMWNLVNYIGSIRRPQFGSH